MPRPKHSTPLLSAGIAALALAAPASAYTTTAAPYSVSPRFAVTYSGAGSFHTKFHATPPNPGGHSDTNDAHDTSRQTWDVKFRRGLEIPACGTPAAGGADPCASLTGLTGARGKTRVTGRVNHQHVDGLYRSLDRTVKCRLSKTPSPRRTLDAQVLLGYDAQAQTIAVTVTDPVATALSLFPAQCPKQGDSIDRILDFYATPGFSFGDGGGADRWFRSRTVRIPAAAFHRASRLRIRLADTPAGTPPRHCAVDHPSYERCSTGGSWNGVLAFTLKR